MAVTLLAADRFFSVLPMVTQLPGVPITFLTPSSRVWRCDTGEHRYHRSKARAQACAFAALPMVRVQ